jgi:hypothetical protein
VDPTSHRHPHAQPATKCAPSATTKLLYVPNTHPHLLIIFFNRDCDWELTVGTHSGPNCLCRWRWTLSLPSDPSVHQVSQELPARLKLTVTRATPSFDPTYILLESKRCDAHSPCTLMAPTTPTGCDAHCDDCTGAPVPGTSQWLSFATPTCNAT